MSDKSRIAWTDSTHNFWRGCSKAATGCEHCYAETLVTTRLGGEWGPGGVRVRSKDFNAPLRWNRKPWVCDQCGSSRFTQDSHTRDLVCEGCETYNAFHRRRVFSLSLGDWLEGGPIGWTLKDEKPIGGIPVSWLADMLDVVRRCDQLSWILCTKRPENWRDRLMWVNGHAGMQSNLDAYDTCPHVALADWTAKWILGEPSQNVTVLTSISTQKDADENIPHLLKIPATRRGLSIEPLLEPVDLRRWLRTREVPLHTGASGNVIYGTTAPELDWLIVGGESGKNARPCNAEWIRGIVRQGKAAGVPVFVKQLGSNVLLPHPHFKGEDDWYYKTKHPKGADSTEWPDDLRLQEFPQGL